MDKFLVLGDKFFNEGVYLLKLFGEVLVDFLSEFAYVVVFGVGELGEVFFGFGGCGFGDGGKLGMDWVVGVELGEGNFEDFFPYVSWTKKSGCLEGFYHLVWDVGIEKGG